MSLKKQNFSVDEVPIFDEAVVYTRRVLVLSYVT